MEGALTYIPTPPIQVLPVMMLGFLWLILWQGRGRVAGLVPVVAAFAIWTFAERPALLISDTGGLIGVMTPQGRVLNKATGEGFAAQSWLENDGDYIEQAGAFERLGLGGSKGDMTFDLGARKFVHLTGRGALERVTKGCDDAAFVILAAEWDAKQLPCVILDRKALAIMGAVAVYETDGGLRLVGAKEQAGERLWNSRDVRRGR
jgi:competence protein ComEC